MAKEEMAKNCVMGATAAQESRELENFISETQDIYMPSLKNISRKLNVPLEEVIAAANVEIWLHKNYYMKGCSKNGVVPVNKRFGRFFIFNVEKACIGKGKMPGTSQRWGRNNSRENYKRENLTDDLFYELQVSPEGELIKQYEKETYELALTKLTDWERELITIYEMVKNGEAEYAVLAKEYGVCRQTLSSNAKDAVARLKHHITRIEEYGF